MHVQNVSFKTYVYAEDKWHLFLHDVLTAVYKKGDKFTYALDRTLSKSATDIIEKFAARNYSEVMYVSEEELRQLAVQHHY